MQSPGLLSEVLDANNAVRQRAEGEINTQRQSNPAGLLQLFITNLKNEKEDISQISCVLFKKYFLDDTQGVNPEDYEQMKQAVLESLDFSSQSLLTLKRKADLLAKIFKLQEQSEQLLGMLVAWAQSKDIKSKQFALYTFEKMTECHLTPEQLTVHCESFYSIFEANMQDSEQIETRVASLKATACFLQSVTDEKILAKFKTLQKQMLAIIVDSLKVDEDQGKQALEKLVDLTQMHSQFWKDSISPLVKIVSDIVRVKDFEHGTRAQAAEVVLNLTEQMPAMMRKAPEMKSEFFPAIVQLVTECEEDTEVWAKSTDDELGTGSDAYSTGVSAIARLSLQMKEKFTIDASASLIQSCLAHADWNVRQAGFMTFGLIAEACKDWYRSNMEEVMTRVCHGIQEEHTRVKYARLAALALIMTQLSPQIQFKFHSELVPALLLIVKNEQEMKVKTQAISCLYHFAKGLIQEDDTELTDGKKSGEIMQAYSDDLFQTLIYNLTLSVDAGYEPLQEQVMNLLNISASLLEDHFAKYFDSFLPLMVKILSNVEGSTVQQKNLRARTIESMGILIASVADQKEFTESVKEVTDKLFALLDQEFDEDDPQELAIKDTIAKISYFLKEDFHHVAPKFLEILAKDALLEVKITHKEARDGEVEATDDKQTSMSFKVFGMENTQKVMCNISELEAKISAFSHIYKVAEAMGEGFGPYVDQVLPIMMSHLDYTSRAVRKYSLKTLQHLVIAKGEPENIGLFRKIYDTVALKILVANKKQNVKELKLLFKGLFFCMRAIKDHNEEEKALFAAADKLQTFGNLMKECLLTVQKVKQTKMQEVEEMHQNVQIDEEDIQEVQLELQKMTGAATYISECCDVLMGLYHEDVTALMDDCVKFYYADSLQSYKTVSESELSTAAYFFIQYVTECKKSTDKMMLYELSNQFAEIAMFLTPDACDARQNTIYGIGVISKFLDTATFSSLLPGSLKAIEHILSDPEAQAEDRLAVTENAFITLGFLSLLHSREPASISKFLAQLPMQGDDEAQEAHEFLFEQILLGNEALLTPDCLPQVKAALEKIDAARTEDNLNEQAVDKMLKAIEKVKAM